VCRWSITGEDLRLCVTSKFNIDKINVGLWTVAYTDRNNGDSVLSYVYSKLRDHSGLYWRTRPRKIRDVKIRTNHNATLCARFPSCFNRSHVCRDFELRESVKGTAGRDSSVGIATRYGLDGTGIESFCIVWWTERIKIVRYVQSVGQNYDNYLIRFLRCAFSCNLT